MTLFVRRRRSQVKFIGKKILLYLVYKINLFIFAVKVREKRASLLLFLP